MSLRALTRGLGIGAFSLAVLLGAPELDAAPSSAQRAQAEALFQRATELMDGERYKEACEKFQASQELDPALGTMLYLADCYDRAGQTASAWALFQEASQKARHSGHADRERIAKERAQELQGRLSLLELRVPEQHVVPGLELTVNGVKVPSASLNTALPVDPGPTRIEARAPDKKPWTTTLTIPGGPVTRVVELGALEALPRTAMSQDSTADRADRSKPTSSAQSTLGYVTGAAGIVALVVGGVFAYRAYDLNQRSKAECRAEDPNACTEQGVELREDAKKSATLSTVVTLGGATLVAGGLVIVLTAPPAPPSRERAALPRGAAVSIRGTF